MTATPMKARFVAAEVARGLRRNLTMTLAVIVTVGVSLSLLGAAWLTGVQVDTMKGFWFDKVQVSVFLAGDVTDAERDELRADLEADPLVEEVFYETREEAYAHFSEQFAGSPDLVDSVSPDSLPESFRVKLSDPTRYAEVGPQYATAPGVQQVTDQSGTLNKLFELIGALQTAAYAAAAGLLGATGLLVFNAMRVAAHQRRREIAVMQLVGASKRFIATPFVIEAALAGLAGAVVGVGGLALVKWAVIDTILAPAFTFTTFVGWSAVWMLAPLLVAVGMGTAAVAAALTVARRLREPGRRSWVGALLSSSSGAHRA